MADLTGIKSEVLGELERRRAGEDEQLSFLPPTRFEPGSAQHAEFAERIERDRRGRPPGARNLATRDAIAFIRRMFGDPFVESARYLAHTPETLAAELSCSKLEAFNALERIRADLRTFIYARMSPMDAQGNAVPPTFNMIFGVGAPAPSSSSAMKPWELRELEKSHNE